MAPVYRLGSGNSYMSYVIVFRENGAPKRFGFPTVKEARTAAPGGSGSDLHRGKENEAQDRDRNVSACP